MIAHRNSDTYGMVSRNVSSSIPAASAIVTDSIATAYARIAAGEGRHDERDVNISLPHQSRDAVSAPQAYMLVCGLCRRTS
jgi:hypothetical protein